MALNPAKQGEALNSPVERASKLNDPQFENQQGYFPYDLTHQEFVTPRFGEITPTMHLDTVPGDRTVVHDNTKLILNQINGNFLSEVNQYVDSFYIPLRSVFPYNYEKLIPNPVKGQDLPNSALPQVPLLNLFYRLYRDNSTYELVFVNGEGEQNDINTLTDAITTDFTSLNRDQFALVLGRITLLATILSRGQLLDYLGLQLDDNIMTATTSSRFQERIDRFFSALWALQNNAETNGGNMWSVSLPLNANIFSWSANANRTYDITTLSAWRSALADIFEAGEIPYFYQRADAPSAGSFQPEIEARFQTALNEMIEMFDSIFTTFANVDSITTVDTTDEPFTGCYNIGKILAYQQMVAQYFTNDHVDNIYSSELFMQNLRSVMFPVPEGSYTSMEPTFSMNGVNYEYDYISYGGFWYSLIQGDVDGSANRQYVWSTLMLLLRRSLRYGDYFSTARPNMLAVSDQLGISVEAGMVSPIDVTKNLLMQRYLNAANYIGQGFLQYMSSIYGIKPSDTGCIPRFVSHRKINIQNQITNNTADNQGAQTTNLVGYSDMSAFDVFIDDFGYLISVTSFDVLPVYKSGIESTYHFADRFDYFNPMLQGIGDQPIRSSELLGFPLLRDDVFGYTMRNAEYKYKLSKCHGAFVNSLPGYMLAYPLDAFNRDADEYDLNINPDFIRDKPVYLDPVIPQMTGISPGEYFHFIVSCTNQVRCARKIQATPGVLF